MALNKNVEFVINLDDKINELLKEYRKKYSRFALFPILQKVNYIGIFFALIIVFISLIIMAERTIIGIILFTISVLAFTCTDYIYIKYLKEHKSEINLVRYQYLNDKLKEYNSFALNCLNRRIQLRRERNNSDKIGTIITAFAVITLPFWEAYVSIYFEKNMVDVTYNQQIKNFLILIICSILLLSLCIGIYAIVNLIKDIFSSKKFYNNLNDIIEVIIENKNNERDNDEDDS